MIGRGQQDLIRGLVEIPSPLKSYLVNVQKLDYVCYYCLTHRFFHLRKNPVALKWRIYMILNSAASKILPYIVAISFATQ